VRTSTNMKTSKTFSAAKLALALFGIALVSGCADARNSGSKDEIPLRRSEQGIRYKLVKIEGRTFVATQSAYGYWTLAGPID